MECCYHTTTDIKLSGSRNKEYNGIYEMQLDLCNKRHWYKKYNGGVIYFNTNINQWCASKYMHNPNEYKYKSQIIFHKLNLLCERCVPLGIYEKIFSNLKLIDVTTNIDVKPAK